MEKGVKWEESKSKENFSSIIHTLVSDRSKMLRVRKVCNGTVLTLLNPNPLLFLSCFQWSPAETRELHGMPRSWSTTAWRFPDPSLTLAGRAIILLACSPDTVLLMGHGPGICPSARVINSSHRGTTQVYLYIVLIFLSIFKWKFMLRCRMLSTFLGIYTPESSTCWPLIFMCSATVDSTLQS